MLKKLVESRMYFNTALPFRQEKKLGLSDLPDAMINGQSTPPKKVVVALPRRILNKLEVVNNFS
jgi:hypothetical protein